MTARQWPPQMVDDVIRAMRERRTNHSRLYPYEILGFAYPEADILALMSDLEDEDVTESGVSLRTGWVRDYLPDIEARIAAFKAGAEVPE